MYRILLPVDSDEQRAISAAEVVAALPRAAEEVHVTILNVQSRVDVTDEGRRVSSDEWYDEEDFPSVMVDVEAFLEEQGVSASMRREHADPASAILEVADEIGANQIVMCGHRRTPVGKVLFGSVTQSVLLNASVPVTVTLD